MSDLSLRADSPLQEFGRARHLCGFDLPFEPLRHAKSALGGPDDRRDADRGGRRDGAWHARTRLGGATDVLTLVPINLRPWSEQGLGAATGNRATGVMVQLPLDIARSARALSRDPRTRDGAQGAARPLELLPSFAEVLALVPRPLYRALCRWSARRRSHLIVTNVPGIMQPRYVAGARITAGYPFAPLAPQCPVSIALYGYDGRLWIGIDADGTAMPDVDAFVAALRRSFDELIAAAVDRPGAFAPGLG